jgi:hypothetical protein
MNNIYGFYSRKLQITKTPRNTKSMNKTFFVTDKKPNNLEHLSLTSLSILPSIKILIKTKPTQVQHLSGALSKSGSWHYLQILDHGGKACQ